MGIVRARFDCAVDYFAGGGRLVWDWDFGYAVGEMRRVMEARGCIIIMGCFNIKLCGCSSLSSVMRCLQHLTMAISDANCFQTPSSHNVCADNC